ncbi:uncharacterized protein [Littorina saxatilis]|uniref:uncharacterized protein n=1 Tax=Littorina saxatilis TaxID=31220 RepID=UPI0038B66271
MYVSVPAQGTCSTQTGTGSERFTRTGSCSLQDGAMTSRGRYRCEWYQRHQTSSKSLIVNKTLTAANYQTECVIKTTVPTVTGRYSYTVTLIPGRAVVNAGDINIVRPSPPTISCSPSGFVPVNTAVTCTCTTSPVSQPQGRLKVVKVTDGTTIATGDYGTSLLRMSPHTLTDSDHDVNTFRCDVEWVKSVTGHNYKPQVGLPPTKASLSLNGNQGDQVVNEHQSVTFHCNATGGRPTPTVTLVNRDNKTEVHSGLSPQQYSVTARCEDTGVYVCTADNGMGPVASSVDTMLGVQCFPRGGEHLGNVSFTGDPVSVTFDVTAYPVPHKVSFTYLGRCECQAGTAPAVEGITLEGRCRAKTGAVYISTCTVTVTSVTTEAAGVYQVIISNTVGNTTFRLNVGVDLAPNAQSANTGNGQAFYLGLVVGFGVTLAVVLIVIIVFFFWLWRRQWTLPCTRDKVELRKHPNIPDDRDSSAVVQDNQETNAHSSTSDLSIPFLFLF